MSEEFRIMNESFKSWFYEHGEDWNSSSIKPVWEAAWKSRIPEGYALVPIEPTKSMRQIGGEYNYAGISLTAACDYAYEVYKAMVNEAVKND